VPWATLRLFITPQISVNPTALMYVQEAQRIPSMMTAGSWLTCVVDVG